MTGVGANLAACVVQYNVLHIERNRQLLWASLKMFP